MLKKQEWQEKIYNQDFDWMLEQYEVLNTYSLEFRKKIQLEMDNMFQEILDESAEKDKEMVVLTIRESVKLFHDKRTSKSV